MVTDLRDWICHSCYKPGKIRLNETEYKQRTLQHLIQALVKIRSSSNAKSVSFLLVLTLSSCKGTALACVPVNLQAFPGDQSVSILHTVNQTCLTWKSAGSERAVFLQARSSCAFLNSGQKYISCPFLTSSNRAGVETELGYLLLYHVTVIFRLKWFGGTKNRIRKTSLC